MDLSKLRKETLKDGTVIAYEDWLARGTQVYVEKDGSFVPATDGTMVIREREEVYISNVEMTIKDGFVTEIKSSSLSVTRKEPEDLTEYHKEFRKKFNIKEV
jgi:hypothetical protein